MATSRLYFKEFSVCVKLYSATAYTELVSSLSTTKLIHNNNSVDVSSQYNATCNLRGYTVKWDRREKYNCRDAEKQCAPDSPIRFQEHIIWFFGH